ncbi:MAG TPA: hypothetical protein VNB64_04275 [Solirubrobacteraceae bacterium]|nr:hypothetical protein [Solirubrobacteraceae bacterium]
MSILACHNPAMRWPWSGIEEELRLMRGEIHEGNARYERLIEEHRRFITQVVTDMRRHAEERERAVNDRLAEIHEQNVELIVEQRAGREALFRMLDRLPPAPGTA